MVDVHVLRRELGRFLVGFVIVLVDLRTDVLADLDLVPDVVGAVLLGIAVARLLLVGGATAATGLAPLVWLLVVAATFAEGSHVLVGEDATSTLVTAALADLALTSCSLALALHLRAVLEGSDLGALWRTLTRMLQVLAGLQAVAAVMSAFEPVPHQVVLVDALAIYALVTLVVLLVAVLRTRRVEAASRGTTTSGRPGG